jgi:PAS domain S-box-containing protein
MRLDPAAVVRDPARLRAVHDLGLLDTPPEEVFDRLVGLAANVFHAPIAALTLVTDERQFFKSSRGLPEPLALARSTPVGESFCQFVVAAGEPFIVEDARVHPLVQRSPLVSEHRWIAYAGAPLRTSAGEVVGAFCVADHRERRWAAGEIEALQEFASLAAAELERRVVRSLLDRIRFAEEPAPMWIFDRESHGIVVVNDAAIAHYGYSRDEFLALRIDDLRPPQDVAALHEQIDHTTGGYDRRGVWTHRKKDGSAIEVEINSHDLVFDGRPSRAVMAIDVTEQRRAERELRASHDMLRAVTEASGDAIFVKDLEGRHLMINQAGARLHGRTADEILGRTDAELLAREPASVVRAREQEVLAAEEPRTVEDNIAILGEQRTLLVTRAPLRDGQDRLAGVISVARDLTEQKRAVAALRASEEKFRTLFECAAIGLAVRDLNGRFIACNPALQYMLGYSEEELASLSAAELTHPDDRPREAEHMQHLVARRIDHFQIEKRYIRCGGDICWGRVTISLIPTASGESPLILTVVEDITDAKRLEEESRARERYFQSLIENATDIVSIVDAAGTIRYESPSIERVLGYLPGELIGRAALDLIHPDDRAELTEVVRRRRWEPRATASAAFRCQHKDETWRFIEATGRNLLQDPAVEGIVVNSRDVTEQRQIENRLRHVTATSPAVLFTLAVEGRAIRGTWVSGNLEEMLGYPSEEALEPEWWTDNLHPDDRAAAMAAFEQLFVEDSLSHEHRFRCKDGSYRWIRAQLRLLRDHDGRAAEIVGSFIDATDFRRLEEQLRQAQKMEAVGRLAGGIAHDFNNILTAITGHTELVLADMPLHDPVRSDIEEVQKAANRACALTRQLLAFSRKQVLRPELLDLGSVVAEMERMLRRVVSEDIELVTYAAADLGCVQADRGQLEQVILNLVVNAGDAMPRGGRLTIGIRRIELDRPLIREQAHVPAGPHITLCVTDTGCGIPKDVVPRIFEPFFTTKEAGKGTGLGLATVYGIVKQSGGYIWISSEVGEGTTFEIYLPEVARDAGGAAARSAVPDASGGTETVLLVEDETAVRELARRILKKLGYTVLEAANGGEALLIARKYAAPIDLMVTDMVMPHMSGSDVAEEMRRIHPELKVLFMSGYTEDDVIRNAALEDGSAFLEKPFTPPALARSVRKMLDGPPAQTRPVVEQGR